MAAMRYSGLCCYQVRWRFSNLPLPVQPPGDGAGGVQEQSKEVTKYHFNCGSDCETGSGFWSFFFTTPEAWEALQDSLSPSPPVAGTGKGKFEKLPLSWAKAQSWGLYCCLPPPPKPLNGSETSAFLAGETIVSYLPISLLVINGAPQTWANSLAGARWGRERGHVGCYQITFNASCLSQVPPPPALILPCSTSPTPFHPPCRHWWALQSLCQPFRGKRPCAVLQGHSWQP